MKKALSVFILFFLSLAGLSQVKVQKSISPKKDTISAFFITNTDFDKFRSKLNAAWGEAYINQEGLMRWSDVKLEGISEQATIELHDGIVMAPGAYQVFQLGNEKEKMLKNMTAAQFRQIEIFLRKPDNSYLNLNAEQVNKFKNILEKNL